MKVITAALAEIASLESGSVFPNAHQGQSEGELPFAKVSDISRSVSNGSRFISTAQNYISHRVANELRAKPFPQNSIVFAKIGEAIRKNNRAITVGPMIFDNNVMGVVPNRGFVDRDYLYYFFTTLDLYALANKTSVPALRKSDLEQIRIPLPPLEEQRRIAAILDATDSLRAKRRAALAKLDQLAQSIFIEMFGDPVSNPMGWPMQKLGDLLRVKSGTGLISANMADCGVYPVYGGNGIAGYHDQYMFEDSQIVIGRVGVYCGAVHFTQPKCWVTDNALYVSVRDEKLKTDYLVAALTMANLNQYAGRAAQPLISGGRIYPIEIMVPEVRVQDRFARALQAFKVVSASVGSSEANLNDLFVSLQHRAFQGQL